MADADVRFYFDPSIASTRHETKKPKAALAGR